jgi:hypothetical protein
MNGTKNIKEYLLYNILCIPVSMKNAASHVENEAAVPPVELCKGFRFSRLQVQNQLFIGFESAYQLFQRSGTR